MGAAHFYLAVVGALLFLDRGDGWIEGKGGVKDINTFGVVFEHHSVAIGIDIIAYLGRRDIIDSFMLACRQGRGGEVKPKTKCFIVQRGELEGLNKQRRRRFASATFSIFHLKEAYFTNNLL